MFLRLISLIVGMTIPTQAVAEGPRVVVDIAPVHALVAQVMDGVGTPDLILRSGASPHSYALRPSDARALQGADLVVWMGAELTPWLTKPIDTLAAKAESIALLESDESRLLPLRDPGSGHDHEHGHNHDTETGGIDPHAWLDPENGKIWLDVIASHLARVDPDNAERYHANAALGQARITQVATTITTMLSPVQGQAHVTFHDAYQYFETRFGLTSAGTVKLSDAADPSPADVAELRETIRRRKITCAFSEPQFDAGLLTAAAEGSNLRIAVLDPMGSALTPGPALYPELLKQLAKSIATCARQ